ncbi:fumarate reductase iron-sulfur subunit [Campylobacter sp. FMV-PI01]|uniref:Fumarate reductase iron-sulfur subunit n=1 Tax=Campylobacter portucalensis TaxID=2608384 RepID=A0A6L5WMX7_9BACT|nr:fumarate reductase iron-sulfur subunit [Campylobacter portucalensis]MSN97021.1 fumarate reductase iron-sulfur subunit [Campylobacter portucalensis]
MSRKITIKALKYNPLSKISKPHFATYELEETSGMTLYVALTQIREKFDSDLSFDFVCRAGICGSCAMVVNGKPSLACRTLTKDFKDGIIELMPLPVFKLIKDLSVNTGEWMARMNKRVESWIHTSKITDISKIETKVDPALAQETFELDRCIECGICVASCGTALMREDFLGAVGLNRVARFKADPLDERNDEDFYELIGDDNGIFGCMSLLGCEDNCPKHLPLQNQIAFIRRKLSSVN